MGCPCENCQYRKLYCHDRCDEYNEWHDMLVEAKRATAAAERALDFLLENAVKRKNRRRAR